MKEYGSKTVVSFVEENFFESCMLNVPQIFQILLSCQNILKITLRAYFKTSSYFK